MPYKNWPVKTCNNCKKVFTATGLSIKYCSHKCYLVKKINRQYYKMDSKTCCWNYLGAKDKDGYGFITRRGKLLRAHRWFYELHKGKIKKNLVIDHLCKNKACVNPEHLEAVTNYENYTRGKNAKLDTEKVNEIRAVAKKFNRQSLSKIFKVSEAQISRIINFKTWKI